MQGEVSEKDDGGPAFPCDSTNKQFPTQCGMVVPDGAPRMWAVKDIDGAMHTVSASRRKSECACADGETVVRVAIVEIKE